jgi:hypothetical protein
LTTALFGDEWSASRRGRFTPGERAPGAHWIGGWVSPRTGLNDVERRNILPLSGPELRPFDRPALSQPLYRLGYPGSEGIQKKLNICSGNERLFRQRKRLAHLKGININFRNYFRFKLKLIVGLFKSWKCSYKLQAWRVDEEEEEE